MIDPWKRPARALDPEAEEPGYWARFRRRTTALAGPELERRRSAETVSDVMTSWSRTIVPSAVAVAATAALLILADAPSEAPAPGSTGVDELVESALNEDPIPALLRSSDGEAVAVTMVDEEF